MVVLQDAAAAVHDAMDPMIKARMAAMDEDASSWSSLDRRVGNVMDGHFPPPDSSGSECGSDDEDESNSDIDEDGDSEDGSDESGGSGDELS